MIFYYNSCDGAAIETYEDPYHDGEVSTNDVWSSTRNESERLKEATTQVLKVNLFNFLVACGKLAVKAVPAIWKTLCTMPNPQPCLHLHFHKLSSALNHHFQSRFKFSSSSAYFSFLIHMLTNIIIHIFIIDINFLTDLILSEVWKKLCDGKGVEVVKVKEAL